MRSFSPRFRLLNYDALHADIGCQMVVGSKVGTVLPFSQECIYLDRPDALFLIPDTECRFLGPLDHLLPLHPYTTQWCAWKQGETIRVGQLDFDTPTSSVAGSLSTLYEEGVTTDKVSAAFSRQGLLAIATQRSLGTIELRRYIDFIGTIQTLDWPGRDPCLLYLGIGLTSEDEWDAKIVCYYSRVEEPGVIFARFETDGYMTERRINSALRSSFDRLQNVRWNQAKVELRGMDQSERFVILSTASYSLLSTDDIGIQPEILDGLYYETGVDAYADPESLALGVTILSGVVTEDAVDAPPDADDMTITTQILAGEYLLE